MAGRSFYNTPAMSQTHNLHTHTARCKHATGEVADYVAAAQKAGLTLLGMSDHCPLPDGRWIESRMFLHELPSYLGDIREAKHANKRIEIWAGLECEGNADYFSFYRDVFLGEHQMDYLVAGLHNFESGGSMRGFYDDSTLTAKELFDYAKQTIRAIESGIFSFIVHPDLFAKKYLPFDEEARAVAHDIASAAAQFHVPLEINGYGMRKDKVGGPRGLRWPYPVYEFWETAAAHDIRVVVNSDAHRPEDIVGGLAEGAIWISQLGLKRADPELLLNDRRP